MDCSGGNPQSAPRSGIHAAWWIPVDNEGNLRRDLAVRHLDWLKEVGLHGLLALGSTGEFPRMSLPQRSGILEETIELAAPLPVIANVSAIRLDEVVNLGRAAKRMGAVGVAIMPPMFYPLTQEDILEFFLRASEKINLPVYLYNYPEVTGNRIGLDVVSNFAEQAWMVGIKQSGNELAYHADLIKLGKEKNFSVFTAADPLLAKYLDLGASGCLGGMPNFVPEYMLSVYAACRAGDSSKAGELSSRLEEAGKRLSALGLPLNVRSAVEARGFEPGAWKHVISKNTHETYRKLVDEMRRLYAEWNLTPIER